MPDWDTLKSFPLLACLEGEDLDVAANAILWKSVKRGEQIVQEGGEGSDGIFFLSSGQLMAVFFTAEGREIVFSIIPDGGYSGELAALDGQLRSLSIYASKDSVIGILPRKTFLHFIDAHQKFRSIVLQNLSTRIRDLTRNVHDLTSLSVKERVGGFIVRMALDRKQFKEGGTLDHFPTHLEIANQIGSNREAVSRTLSALNQSGAIHTRSRTLSILKPEALTVQDFSA